MSWRSRRKGLGSSIPYSKKERRQDRKHGKRDGRKRLPTYSGVYELAEASATVTTPYQEQLSHAGSHQINDEFLAYVQRAERHKHRLAELRSSLTMAEQAVGRAKEKLIAAQAELSDADLVPRNPQELALAGTAELRSRYAARRDQRIEAAEQDLDRRQIAADACAKQIEEACDRIDQEFAVAQAHGQRIADYYTLRIATYWDAVVQKHPEGRNLAPMLPPVPATAPAWITATSKGGVITPAPAPGPDEESEYVEEEPE
jgi:hypothetical protein